MTGPQRSSAVFRRLRHRLAVVEMEVTLLELALAKAAVIERKAHADLALVTQLAEEAGIALGGVEYDDEKAEPVFTSAFRDVSLVDAAPILGRTPNALGIYVRRHERRGRCEVAPGVLAYRRGRRWFVRIPTASK